MSGGVGVVVDVVVVALLAVGTLFVVVGTVGVLRLPDLATRLHAVAKADNLGLGLIVAALVLRAVTGDEGGGVAAKLVLVWLLALLATAANGHLLARRDRATDADDERRDGSDASEEVAP
ncbi:monovalent cation/H(+) antiporter subunit G [Litorihabitans aurantiacus]|uniref:Monovalent cation/H(+) antiporter subunit G n=1 Tax=Litorihabitans aurantiacus TaxID=1930061 RepID=A0AA37UQX3_9MICO|nr:monovalent cation/H(+) antiporter subunit G [Litorihabitans aurantiacus]GMA31331.1 hypothetical protein GCM10025875_13230 [Litorihabitans aurantiacus]